MLRRHDRYLRKPGGTFQPEVLFIHPHAKFRTPQVDTVLCGLLLPVLFLKGKYTA